MHPVKKYWMIIAIALNLNAAIIRAVDEVLATPGGAYD